jgi:ATP-dependent RNA helicase RhlE
MSFEDLQLVEPILDALRDEGYQQPTPIQTQAIPSVLNQQDLLAVAQTGTGKTAAFAVPILQQLYENRYTGKGKRRIKALVITPTRELAIQIDESFSAYGRYTGLKNTVVFGGVGKQPQINALKRGIDILVATPGRLLDLIDMGHVDLQYLQHFVLDEADRMLDMGFIHDVRRVLKQIPDRRQTLFFSATMPPSIVKLSRSILTNPKRVEVAPVSSTADTVQQFVYYTNKKDKRKLLLHVLEQEDIPSALVFTRTKYGADKLSRMLKKMGINSNAIHGNKGQNERQKALRNFKNKKTRVLVATDIAARGIDVDDLSYVINFEIPNVAETYVHRIGRTGRAGADGVAISFCDHSETDYIKDIHKLIRKQIPVIKEHPFPIADEAPEPVAPVRQKRSHNGRRYGRR